MRRRLLISLIALFALETGIPLYAATRTWTGTTSGTWSVASNWGGTAPSAGDDLVFSTANNTAMNNDFPANTVFHSMTFNASTNWIILGNAIDVGAGGITITGGSSLNAGIALTLTAAQTWTCDSPGDFRTQQIDLGANTLNIGGNAGAVFLQKDISGTGGITIGGTPVVELSGTNLNYTGATIASSGATVRLVSPGIISTPFTIGSGGTFLVPAGSIPTIINSLALNSGSTDQVQINGAATAQYSQAAASGATATITIAGNLSVTSSTFIHPGSVLTILNGTSGATVTGTFAGLPDGSIVSSGVQSYLLNYTPNAVTLTALSGTVAPPSLSETFGQPSIQLGGTTALTFTVKNPNAGSALSGVGLNDSLPAGLVVATPNGLSGSCGSGTITAAAGSSGISLSGAALAASASCTFSVNVTGTGAGALNNLATPTSTEGGSGNQAMATLNVYGPATLSKAFGASAIPSGKTTTLTFTLGNPLSNPALLSQINFSDSLPAGMSVATPANASTNCAGANFLAPAGASTISLDSATLSPGSTCTAVVDIESVLTGTANNTSGTVGSVEGPDGAAASASLNVLAPGATAPPALSKSFGAEQIALGGTTSITFTVTNANAGTLTNVGFNDPLPAGLIVSTPNGLSGTCGGGAITADAGSSSVTLSGATVPGDSICTFSVNVTGTTAGEKDNQTSNVTSTEGGSGNQAQATVAVVAPPTVSKTFSASAIAAGQTATVTLTFGNPASNSVAITNLSVNDSLPAGMALANPMNFTDLCGFSSIIANPGGLGVSLAGGNIKFPGTTCTTSFDVTSSTVGTANNTTGNVSSDNGGTGTTASASLTILTAGTTAPPSISKSFGAQTIPVDGSTWLSFTLNNPNLSASLSGVGFTDTLPSGLTVATPSGLSGSCGGGTITATAGSGTVSLSGATLGTGANCTFSVNVIGTSTGLMNNTTTNVTSTEGGSGNQGTATLTVLGPPTIAKAFGASSINATKATTLTFTLGNPAANPVALNGVAFSDSLPAGMTVASPAGATTNCSGATLTAVAGASSISLSGATISSGATCTATVNVTAGTAGTANNTSGAVSSTNGGTGSTASASLTINPAPPSISKSFGAAGIPVGGSTSLTFTLHNPNSGSSLTSIGFTDPLPAGLNVATPNGLSGSCGGGAITAAAGSGTVSLSGATLAASAACTFSVNVIATSTGPKNNQTTNVTSAEGGAGNQATATVTVLMPPTIAKAFGAASINAGDTTTLTFTLGNPATNPAALNGISFSDSFPSGMRVASPAGATTTCTGATFAPVAGASTLSFTGATINSGATCTATVNVTSIIPGTANNTTGTVSSTNGGTGLTATASMTIKPAANAIPALSTWALLLLAFALLLSAAAKLW